MKIVNIVCQGLSYSNSALKSQFFMHRSNQGTGHYTQLVWAKTFTIGCGYIKYREHHEEKEGIMKRLVCNYGPAGNVFDQPVYAIK